MARKVFVSFLGGTNYKYCEYKKNDISYGTCRFIQESTLNYLLSHEQWGNNDLILILLTKGAEEKNWVNGGQIDKNTKEILIDETTGLPYEGLHDRLKHFNLPIQTINNLPDGNNEKEIMEIFIRLYDALQPQDEVYFDITHGFRYLPMLMLVLGNYASFLKNIQIRSITYGNFEIMRNLQHGLIVDMSALLALQQWTAAANLYVKNGNVEDITALLNKDVKPMLRDESTRADARPFKDYSDTLIKIVNSFRTCRGIDVVEAQNIQKMNSAAQQVKQSLFPVFNPIFDRVNEDLESLDNVEPWKNSIYAAKWCCNKGLYQQAITILQEGIITYFCMKYNLNYTLECERKLVECAWHQANENSFKMDTDKTITPEKEEYYKSIVLQIAEQKDNIEILSLLRSIRDIRNDYNHSGIRNNPMPAEKIITKIKEQINKVSELLLQI